MKSIDDHGQGHQHNYKIDTLVNLEKNVKIKKKNPPTAGLQIGR